MKEVKDDLRQWINRRNTEVPLEFIEIDNQKNKVRILKVRPKWLHNLKSKKSFLQSLLFSIKEFLPKAFVSNLFCI